MLAVPVEPALFPRIDQLFSTLPPEIRIEALSPARSPTTRSLSGSVIDPLTETISEPLRIVVPPPWEAVEFMVRFPFPVFTKPPSPVTPPLMIRSKPFVSMVPVSFKS